MLLVIGNKNYSSWSLRPWLAMKVLGLAFDEKRIALYDPGAKAEILRHSPSGKVPCLVEGSLAIWDSLAILEYLAERHPQLWPADAAERARARSIAAEMHAGFAHLRNHMGMNVRKRYPGRGRTPEVLEEVKRIDAIGHACIQLPEDHGIIFPGGYYLIRGEAKLFDHDPVDMELQRAVRSPNGEDVL